MITPPPLEPGDTIAILSTARKIEPEPINFAADVIAARGYQVKRMPNLFSEDNQFASTDAQRAADLQKAINDPDIRAILCARGGYGTVRLLPLVDFSPLLNEPKWIAGYSDVTVLHSHLNTMGIASLHSTMPVNFEKNSMDALLSLFSFLAGDGNETDVTPHDFNRIGSAKAEMVGGNLSILYSLTGTSSCIDTKGKILFLEDLDEYLYHVDRMMQNLKLSGMLDGLAGLVVGGMSDMNDNTIPYGHTALEIIRDAVAPYDYPVCFGFPSGHFDDNRAWINGGSAKLEVRADRVLFQQ